MTTFCPNCGTPMSVWYAWILWQTFRTIDRVSGRA